MARVDTSYNKEMQIYWKNFSEFMDVFGKPKKKKQQGKVSYEKCVLGKSTHEKSPK